MLGLGFFYPGKNLSHQGLVLGFFSRVKKVTPESGVIAARINGEHVLDRFFSVIVLAVSIGCLQVTVGVAEVLWEPFGQYAIIFNRTGLVLFIVPVLVSVNTKEFSCLFISKVSLGQ